MILVDTSVWIDYFNGLKNKHTDKLDELLSSELIIIGDIILAETLQGFRKDKDFVNAKEALSVIACYSISNKKIAIKSAENFRNLRKKGITIRKTTDMLIGIFCIENNIPLLHNDRDFLPLEMLGLKSVC
ncbi:MAG: PIN domain nuclease [Bacteroidales bacterium]|nr:PIN domain nuclease [Bacteroidales bacterium]